MSQPIHVLDDYYLAITLLVTIAYQIFFFAIAFSLKFDKLTDFAGGTNFVVLAVLTLALSSTGTGLPNARQLVVSLFLAVWGLRLSGFLLFRILKTGKDDRFDDKRDKFFRFLGFWVFQMLWVWICSLPVTVLNSPAVQAFPQPAFGTGRDIAGVVLYAVGLVMETVSDAQRYRFRARNGRPAVCDGGFFYVSRHPNYFGEIIVQFGEPLSPPRLTEYILTPPPSHLHHSRHPSRRRLRHRRRLRRPLRHHPQPLLHHLPPHVHLGAAAVGAPRVQEAVRGRHQLGRLRALPQPHEHPHPVPAAAVRADADVSEADRVSRVSHVRV
jgi:steroid 5-alpha reductase family enzyme